MKNSAGKRLKAAEAVHCTSQMLSLPFALRTASGRGHEVHNLHACFGMLCRFKPRQCALPRPVLYVHLIRFLDHFCLLPTLPVTL